MAVASRWMGSQITLEDCVETCRVAGDCYGVLFEDAAVTEHRAGTCYHFLESFTAAESFYHAFWSVWFVDACSG